MSKENISYDDLCNLIANYMGKTSSPVSVDRYLRAIYSFILRQLELNKKIYFKDFGSFEIRERKSGERIIYNPNTKQNEVVYVKPKFVVTFKPSSKLDYAINENNFNILHRNRTIEHNKVYKRKKNDTIASLLNKAQKRDLLKKEKKKGK